MGSRQEGCGLCWRSEALTTACEGSPWWFRGSAELLWLWGSSPRCLEDWFPSASGGAPSLKVLTWAQRPGRCLPNSLPWPFVPSPPQPVQTAHPGRTFQALGPASLLRPTWTPRTLTPDRQERTLRSCWDHRWLLTDGAILMLWLLKVFAASEEEGSIGDAPNHTSQVTKFDALHCWELQAGASFPSHGKKCDTDRSPASCCFKLPSLWTWPWSLSLLNPSQSQPHSKSYLSNQKVYSR